MRRRYPLPLLLVPSSTPLFGRSSPFRRLLPLVYLDNDGTVNTLAAASRSLRGIDAASAKGDAIAREIATDISLYEFYACSNV